MVKFPFIALLLVVFGIVAAHRRCGVDDSTIERIKRYTLRNNYHKNLTVSYRISDYSKNVSHEETDDVLARAFQVWTEHTDLTFVKKQPDEEADIDIRFAIREHGHGFPFDGPGGILAHADRPYVHFDDEETWKAKPKGEGTSLFKVAVHEIGHSLGLGHSDEIKSIMFFAHLGDDEDEFQLDDDDVRGITEIYGEKLIRPPFHEDLCIDPTFDTMFNTPDGRLYVFKKDKYYELRGTAIIDGPKPISDKWVGLPDNINGAFTKNGSTIFFKEDLYWRFTGDKMNEGYPIRLDRFYSEIPNNFDDVTVWKDGKIYFFRGSKFYRMDDFKEQYDTIYENFITAEWKGVANRTDAVHYNEQWDLTFFFKIDQFYAHESNDKEAYAIPTASYFFNCNRDE